MRSYIEYIKYILKHKWFVLVECFKRGLYWQGITHDLSKLYRNEFVAYMNYFTVPRLTGNKASKEGQNQFDYAWLHHQHRNKHHWQYWLMMRRMEGDLDEVVPLQMPRKYRIEMLCDWIGAGKAITGKDNLREWYKDNKDKIVLHPKTRRLLEEEMLFDAIKKKK